MRLVALTTLTLLVLTVGCRSRQHVWLGEFDLRPNETRIFKVDGRSVRFEVNNTGDATIQIRIPHDEATLNDLRLTPAEEWWTRLNDHHSIGVQNVGEVPTSFIYTVRGNQDLTVFVEPRFQEAVVEK